MHTGVATCRRQSPVRQRGTVCADGLCAASAELRSRSTQLPCCSACSVQLVVCSLLTYSYSFAVRSVPCLPFLPFCQCPSTWEPAAPIVQATPLVSWSRPPLPATCHTPCRPTEAYYRLDVRLDSEEGKAELRQYVADAKPRCVTYWWICWAPCQHANVRCRLCIVEPLRATLQPDSGCIGLGLRRDP